MLVAVVALTQLGALAVSAQDREKRVLVLFSTRRDAPASITGDRELPRILEQGLREGMHYYSEYIDLGRFPDPAYQAVFSEFLSAKYKGQRFDLIIAVQDAAVEFVEKHRHQFLPDIPIVFMAMSPPPRRPENSTGVIAQLDLPSTLELAADLQPGLRHVFVVSGAATTDKVYERRAREQLRAFESRFDIRYLSGLATRDLEAQLASLPTNSIIYYLVVYQDATGELFSPLQYLERLSAVANAPTYSWTDAVIDRGIVGGSLLDQRAMMEAIGQLALRVLHGERADSIPVTTPDLSVRQVDWRELRRWGIREARVPDGTLVRFQELTVWDRYRVYILGAAIILLIQTALIAGLLVQRARRRQAEEEVRGSQAALRSSDHRIRDLGIRLLHAQDAERARIARELHDDISQQMALLEIDLELLGNGVQSEARSMADETLKRARSIAKSVHDLSHRLHPARLRLIGLVTALRGLERELSQSGMTISVTHENVPKSLPSDLTLSLFRVAQEALQNAVKYSQAGEVSLHLKGDPKGLELTIVDDGIGFDVEAVWGSGLGLVSMRERIEAVGGTLRVRSAPGTGTRLEIAVPLPEGQMDDLPRAVFT